MVREYLATLKEQRLARGWSQTTASIKIGISLPTYRLWELRAATPQPENFKNLQKVFDIPDMPEGGK